MDFTEAGCVDRQGIACQTQISSVECPLAISGLLPGGIAGSLSPSRSQQDLLEVFWHSQEAREGL